MFSAPSLPNDYHLELYTTEEGLLDSEYDVDNPAPAQLAACIAAFNPDGTNATTVGACRAYFNLNGINATDPANSVRAFVLNFGDDSEASGISDATRLNNNEQIINNKWYDLDGRRLNGKPTKKGVYIHGGRKVVVK